MLAISCRAVCSDTALSVRHPRLESCEHYGAPATFQDWLCAASSARRPTRCYGASLRADDSASASDLAGAAPTTMSPQTRQPSGGSAAEGEAERLTTARPRWSPTRADARNGLVSGDPRRPQPLLPLTVRAAPRGARGGGRAGRGRARDGRGVGGPGTPLPVACWGSGGGARAGRGRDRRRPFALYAAAPLLLGSLRGRPLVFHFHGPWAEESVAAGDESRAR